MVDDHVTDVTTWTLEMTSPDQLRPGREPTDWLERMSWDRDRWIAWLDRPELATWVLTVRGTPAGYVELEAQPHGDGPVAPGRHNACGCTPARSTDRMRSRTTRPAACE